MNPPPHTAPTRAVPRPQRLFPCQKHVLQRMLGVFSRMDPVVSPIVLTALGYAIKHWLKKDPADALDSTSLLGDTADIFTGLGANFIHDALKSRTADARAAASFLRNQHLDVFVAEVIKALTQRFAADCQHPGIKKQLTDLARDIPEIWTHYADEGHLIIEKYQGQNFARLIADQLASRDALGAPDPEELAAFFKWIATESQYNHLLDNPTLDYLTTDLAKRLPGALADALASSHPTAGPAFKKTLLRLQSQTLHDLAALRAEMVSQSELVRGDIGGMALQLSDVQRCLTQWTNFFNQHHSALRDFFGRNHDDLDAIEKSIRSASSKLDSLITTTGEIKTTGEDTNKVIHSIKDELTSKRPPASVHYESLVQQYRQKLVRAFEGYEDLETSAISEADGKTLIKKGGKPYIPVIGDIFVEPACSTEREACRPDEFDKRHAIGQHAQDKLLAHLAGPERRMVLLADPGFGKSTLLQWLIVSMSLPARQAPAELPEDLRGQIPLPIIIRDLAIHLGDDLEQWRSWDAVLQAWRKMPPPRTTGQPSLLADFNGEAAQADFETLLRDERAYFLLDGLDEVGNLEKRRALASAIQHGMLEHRQARWLVTSRIIGYNDAPLDYVRVGAAGELKDIARQEALEDMDGNLGRTWRYFETQRDILQKRLEFEERYAQQLDILPRVAWDFPDESLVHIASCVYLAPFDNDRQQRYTQRWFASRTGNEYDERADKLIAESRLHEGVRVISRIPSVLCLMAILRKKNVPLPDGRAELYFEITKAYLKTIDQARGILRPFTDEQAVRWLSLIAAFMQSLKRGQVDVKTGVQADALRRTTSKSPAHGGEVLITLEEVRALLAPELGRACADDPAQMQPMLVSFLSYIASRSGLLQPRARDQYGFVHLSFLEYFCSCYLWSEIERIQQRNARRQEEQDQDRQITDAELEAEYPAGPIPIERALLPQMAADTNWHEVLIFLVEAHTTSKKDLLRWLFPALHGTAPLTSSENELPLPLATVELALRLAFDAHVELDPAHRQRWWRTLWAAYLEWPHPPWDIDDAKRWAIAPLLLGREEGCTEVIQALAEVQPILAEKKPDYPGRCINLYQCNKLTAADLQLLNELHNLEELHLSGCTGLEALPNLNGCKQLTTLYLSECTGLKEAVALRHLSGLGSLETLFLWGCTRLQALPALSGCTQLKKLDLRDCTSLKSAAAIQPLAGLHSLETLHLSGCTGLDALPDLSPCVQLKRLYMRDCTGVKSAGALQHLAGLQGLAEFSLIGCTGLDKSAIKQVRAFVPQNCLMIGPSGKEVRP